MGNNFAHLELSTDGVDEAKRFYKRLFDWKITDLPAMDYALIDTGSKKTGGGLTRKMMPGQPTAWMPYVEVASVKATMKKAAKAGAQVVLPFQSIGEHGAVGVFVDPTGATLGLWEAPKKAAKRVAAKRATAKKPSRTAKRRARRG